jgi:hypothetical protein
LMIQCSSPFKDDAIDWQWRFPPAACAAMRHTAYHEQVPAQTQLSLVSFVLPDVLPVVIPVLPVLHVLDGLFLLLLSRRDC